MAHRILVILLFTATFCYSQKGKQNPKVTLRGTIGIPKSISSQMYRIAFNGIYEANLSVNHRIFSNFFVGLGYQNSNFQNNKKVFAFYQAKNQKGQNTGAFLSYNTRMIGHGAFMKLGYDQFFEKGYVSYALNTGMMIASYNNVVNDTTPANRPYVSRYFNAPYVQPEVAVNFLADRSVSFSLILSYTTLLYKFDPKAPRFNGVEQVVVNTKNNYFISWINIGFGCNVLIGSK